MRDDLGTFFTDEEFVSFYPTRGRPVLSPWRLALVTILQFVENLSDRQTAEAVRARIDWKYALSLDLDDPGFDASVLSEFRTRLVEGNAEHLLLDRMFHVDWGRQRAVCPQGKFSTYWREYKQKPYKRPVVTVRFSSADCSACSGRGQCVRSRAGNSRALVLPVRAHYEALQRTREQITTREGSIEYRKRAGVEGSHWQAVRRCGMRQCRYTGLAKTHLQHTATAAALNLVRIVNHLNDRPLAQTRTSRFARLAV